MREKARTGPKRQARGRDTGITKGNLVSHSRPPHITRAILCYAWEGYHAGDNVYLSRPTHKWVRELVGTISLDRFADADELRDELIGLLFQAVVGCSRLPLQSVEAPLPAYSLGWLA